MTLVERLRERAKQMDVIASPEAARAFGYGPEKVAWHKEAADEAREAADHIEELRALVFTAHTWADEWEPAALFEGDPNWMTRAAEALADKPFAQSADESVKQ